MGASSVGPDDPRRLPVISAGPDGSGSPGPPLLDGDASPEELVIAYHERTKHHLHAFAAALGYMDWATQPDPFRRYAGAPLLRLPLPEAAAAPAYDDLYRPGRVAPAPLSLASVSRFFRASLSLTAWKRAGDTTWSLRANPSSGNLHPTEAYAVLPALEGLHDRPGVYHYAPKPHGLERRAELATWPARLAAGAFLVGLSSVHWREAWKYGERAFRYCQHDVGHALAALRIAAAALGWRLSLVSGAGDDTVARLFGLDRQGDFGAAEREAPELVAVVTPAVEPAAPPQPTDEALADVHAVAWSGRANRLSPEHAVDWPVIDEVARATRRAPGAPIREDLAGIAAPVELVGREVSADRVILGRRSAVAMDGTTSIPAETFFRMLARLVPDRDGRAMPWDAIAWAPRLHLGLFVHRVAGLEPGLYALVRDPDRLEPLRAALRGDFLWQKPTSCPPGLALYLLQPGDCRALASHVSCGQDLAGAGAFSLGMLADYMDSLVTHGAAFYRQLFWEAGMIGQVLYLEAEAASVRGTGIGCYFDDLVHQAFGIASREWQSFYHFSVGGPLEDTRLTTLPAYG